MPHARTSKAAREGPIPQMHATRAAQLLTEQTYKPGSRLRATAIGDTKLMLDMSFETHDSTPEWDGSHRAGRFGTPPIFIDVDGLDAEGVLGCGLLAIRAVEDHETREFYRVQHGIAPFHPHNKSGEAAWERIQKLRDRVSVMYPLPNGA